MNISKETTAQELCYIRGVPEVVRRAIGVNLSGGHVNAVEICMQVFSAPSPAQLLAAFDEDFPHLVPAPIEEFEQQRHAA